MPFKKGESGNPGGRPKGRFSARELREKLSPLVPGSIEELERIIREAKYDSDRLKAISLLYDRVFGRSLSNGGESMKVEHSHVHMVDRPPKMTRDEWLEAYKKPKQVEVKVEQEQRAEGAGGEEEEKAGGEASSVG